MIFLVTQMVKHLPKMLETWVQSLGWEDPLEEGMATYSSILAWRIPLDRGAWRAAVHGVTKSRTQLKQLRTQTYLTKIFLKINFPLGFTKFLAPVFYVIIFPAIFSCPQLLSSCRPCLLSCISEG